MNMLTDKNIGKNNIEDITHESFSIPQWSVNPLENNLYKISLHL